MSKRFTACIAILASVAGLTIAQAASSAEKSAVEAPASLSEAIELALQNRMEMQIKNLQSAVQESEVKKAQSAFLPRLDAFIEGSRISNYDTFSGYIVTVPFNGQIFTARVDQAPIPYQLTDVFELKYNVYAGGRDAAVLDEARANKSSADYEADSARNRIALDVATAYWELRKSQITVRIEERWRDHHLASLALAEKEFEAGRIPAIDKEAASLRLQEQEAALAQAQRELNNRARKYRIALGLGSDGSAVPGGPRLTDDPDAQIGLPGENSAPHPELSRLESEIAAAGARRKMVRSEFLPKIDLFAQYAHIGRDFESFPNAYEDLHRNYFLFGFRVTLNLFEGFRTRQDSRKAALEERLARIHYEQRKQELQEAAQECAMRLEKAQEDLTLAQQRARLGEMQEKIANARRLSGKYSELEFRRVQVSRNEGADRMAIAKIDVSLARIHLRLCE